jgi:hypothetical protein
MSALIEWVAAVGGPVGVVAGVTGARFLSRKKTDAEAAEVVTRAAVALLAPLQEQVTKLATRVEALEVENTATKSKLQLAILHIRELRSWIDQHIPGKTPPQTPAGLGL